MFDDKKVKTKKRTGFLGDYEEHYDKSGKKIGTTKKRTGFLGDYAEHYDKSGKKIGTTKNRTGFLGNYEEHYDKSGKKIGKTKNRTGILGNYEEHYDKSGKKIGTTKNRTGFLGDYKEHSSGNSGCFLTTACVTYHKLPDDCYQLETLRKFRDTYMMSFEKGHQDVMEYYEIAPKIVEKINGLPQTQQSEIYSYLLDNINDCVELIENGKKQECYVKYKEMVEYLQKPAKSLISY